MLVAGRRVRQILLSAPTICGCGPSRKVGQLPLTTNREPVIGSLVRYGGSDRHRLAATSTAPFALSSAPEACRHGGWRTRTAVPRIRVNNFWRGTIELAATSHENPMREPVGEREVCSRVGHSRCGLGREPGDGSGPARDRVSKGCNGPTNIGSPYTCSYTITNNQDNPAHDTLTITSIVDVVHAAGGRHQGNQLAYWCCVGRRPGRSYVRAGEMHTSPTALR